MDYVRLLQTNFPRYFKNKKVLEIGSLNINGTIRIYFYDCEYIGVDLGPGCDVEVIGSGHELDYPDNSFDVIASCECFEHNKYWLETFNNMIRMAKEFVFFSCATTGRPEHGTTRTTPKDAPFTNDYYRNLTEKDFTDNVDMSVFSEYEFTTNDQSHDLYFYGVLK